MTFLERLLVFLFLLLVVFAFQFLTDPGFFKDSWEKISRINVGRSDSSTPMASSTPTPTSTITSTLIPITTIEPPPFPSCPTGMELIGTYADTLRRDHEPTSYSYPFDLAVGGDIQLLGWVMEGHLDRGCRGDLSCDQNQDHEDIIFDMDGIILSIYEDSEHGPSENVWYFFGPIETDLIAGSHTLIFRHTFHGEGAQTAGYRYSLCGPMKSTATPTPSLTPTPTQIDDVQPSPPIRAAFYYPWFPQAWDQQGVHPYTNYTPELGYYDSGSPEVITQHIGAMQYANIQVGIASWWGQSHHTDQRMPTILENTAGNEFRWSIYYEPEGQVDPSVAQIEEDLTYLQDHYGHDPSFLRIDGRFVIFVYADPADGCAMVDRWERANSMDAYLVLKVFSGYRDCLNQPDGWHQYAPAQAADSQVPYSYTISPEFWKFGESPRLERNRDRWNTNIRDMIDSGAIFQLITTFNEWGEGTSVESAQEWSSDTGYGYFLDALHNDGVLATPTPLPSPTVVAGSVLVGAGDIAMCDRNGDEITAALLDAIPGTVFTTGDNAYESGTPSEFRDCYHPSWGRHKARTRPSLGNHEYLTAGAAGYFDYFGEAAGDPNKGYYSYDLGSWHVVVLNTNCSKVGGCGRDSPQEQWLQEDLASNPAACSLAYFHHPRWSSGRYQINESVEPLYQALYDYGVDLALTGHAHNYERFAPQDPQGNLNLTRGIRQIVIGTGGKNHTSASVNILPNSEVRNDDTFGVLRLILYPTSYEWQFIPEPGKSFTDWGYEACR